MKKNTHSSTSTTRTKSTNYNRRSKKWKDPVAKDLRTPKYKMRVVPNKKKHLPPIEEL